MGYRRARLRRARLGRARRRRYQPPPAQVRRRDPDDVLTLTVAPADQEQLLDPGEGKA